MSSAEYSDPGPDIPIEERIPEGTLITLQQLNNEHQIRNLTRDDPYVKGVFAIDTCDVPDVKATPPTASSLRSLASTLVNIDVSNFHNPTEARQVILHKIRMVLEYARDRRLVERQTENAIHEPGLSDVRMAVA